MEFKTNYHGSVFIKKMVRFMKMMTIFLLATCLIASAKGFAQKVTISQKNIKLEKVFKEIREQTGYVFFFDASILRKTTPVSIQVKNKPIAEVLKQCLQGQSLDFLMEQKTITIVQKQDSLNRRAKLLGSDQSPKDLTYNQADVITGTVNDLEGHPLMGVTVKVDGTKRGTSTQRDGHFSIEANVGDVLIFSIVGYKKVNHTFRVNTPVIIAMEPEVKEEEEIVVIGYGSQRRRDVTGSVASVKADDLSVNASSNFMQSLQGKATGIQVIQSTGQPGANVDIKIRSNPSNADPGTLYVIDGVVVNNNAGTPQGAKYGSTGVSQSPMNFINPNDIESIEILKDASSRAIYGAQAGSGVVLITTKHGKTGNPSVQYTGSYANQQVDKMYQVLGTKDYMEQRNLIGMERYLQQNEIAPYYGTVDMSSVPPYQPVYSQTQIDTTPVFSNAMEAIIQSGYTQQHNISVSATKGKTSYFISGNYYDQKGVILGTDYKRWNGRANIDQVLSDKVKVGINLIGSNSTSSNAVTGGQFENGGIITAALYYPASMALQLPDGSYPLNPSYTNIPNPLSYNTITDQLKKQRLLTAAYAQWEIVPGLMAKGNFSFDQGTAKRYNYLPKTFSYGAQVNGIAKLSNNSFTTKQIDYTLNYKHDFKSNQSLDLLAGYTYQLQTSEGLNAGNQNFTSDIISYYNLGAGQADKPTVGSFKTEVTYASYFARAIYQLERKYTLQASVRRDGSSRFAENHKWGYFPAVSAGWTVSDENFLRDNKLVNFLKLRVGYGEIGNANFPASAFEVYGLTASPNFGTGTSLTGIALSQAANPDLKWETAAEFNIGLDFAILHNRLTGSVDYFNKTIRNLITYIPFPADFTVGGVYGNSGRTKSMGYEIGLQSKNITSKENDGFNWSTTQCH